MLNLMMAFIVWFVVSALVCACPNRFQAESEPAVLARGDAGLGGRHAAPIHMFLTPMYGTRNVVDVLDLSLLIPLLGWFYAIQYPPHPIGF